VTAAAIFAPMTLRTVATTNPVNKALLSAAAQKMLTLISFWCFASMALRITDFIVALSLDLHHSPYDITALIGFDGVTAVLATWLRVNLTNRSVAAKVTSALCGALFVFAFSRIIIGVVLAPRIVYVDGVPPYNPVYGNTLAQQITSTFDVVVCGLALCVLAAAVVVGQLETFLSSRRRSIANPSNDENPLISSAAVQPQAVTTLVGAGAAAPAGVQQARPRIFRDVDPSEQQLATATIAPSPVIHAAAPAAEATQHLATATPSGPNSGATPQDLTQQLATAMPKIFRSAGEHTEQFAAAAPPAATQQLPTGAASVQRLLAESSQRFAAGTTYTGPDGGRTAPVSPAPAPPAAAAPPPVVTVPQPPAAAAPAPPVTNTPPQVNPVSPAATHLSAPAPYVAPQPTPAAPSNGPAVPVAAAPGAPASTDAAVQWLSSPQHLKAVIGAVGLFVAVIVFFAADDPVAKLIGVGIAVAAWVLCFRHGYHEKAGLQLQTRIDADEVIRVATDLAAGLQGPMSNLRFNGSAPDRLDFTVTGVTWEPLTFHMSLLRDPAGWTFVTTHLDTWTWRRQRWNFIPVPFTKRMDGYGLYKTFGDRVLGALRERDPVSTGTFHKRLPQ
jgi:hypothetical protein